MGHNYLHDLYDRINETPMQRKLRRLAPMPIGAVFIQWAGMTEEQIRGHLRTMKQLGYTNLKGDMIAPPMTRQRLAEIALEEGITPWFYDIGGWEEITPELLKKLGLPENMDIDAAIAHPAMIRHQQDVLRQRIKFQAEEGLKGIERRSGFLPAESDPNAVAGVVNSPEGTKLAPETIPYFVKWLEKTYGTVAALKHAWNAGSSSVGEPTRQWTTWDDVNKGVADVTPREFRHLRDILKFKSEVKVSRLRAKVENNLRADPNEPMRAGGEISIFLPHVGWAIDMEGVAQVMADGGAFYPSMHPGWHLEEVEFELLRPTYMQASMCVDWSKGIWSAPFESSGGPQWWSGGGKVPFVPEVKQHQPAFTFTEGTMTQLIYSYLGAGFKGFGLWCWNPREEGWEAGEYALCDRNNQPTPRAVKVGQIGKAMTQWRREIWDGHKEPSVGLFQDWENDAMWAALATCGRDRYRMDPIKARIGAARALINANVPWEHITFRQMQKGLAPRYPVIYLPAVMCITDELMDLLTAYVEQGGRLVMDMPGAYLDQRGHLIATGKGSKFEKLFGVVLHEYGYVNNIRPGIGELQLDGFTAVMTATTARTLRTFSGAGGGGAAVTENKLGKGTAVVVGAAASLSCYRPGNAAMEWFLVATALGDHVPPFACDGAICYRMASPKADHYFLLNDAETRPARLDVRNLRYSGARDVLTNEPIDLGKPIEVPACSGRWIRCQK